MDSVALAPPAPAPAPGAHVHSHEHAVDPARPYVAAVLLVLAAAFLLSRLIAPAPWQGAFAAYFLAYALEATPFILLGALLSGLMETLLPAMLLPRLTARLGAWGVPTAALLSPLFPTCECGVVPIGRGLVRKGLALGPVLAYLLAAPILNPMVLWTTWLAFQDWHYVVWRAIGGLLVACGVGWALGRFKPEWALKPVQSAEFKVQSAETVPSGAATGRAHHSEPAAGKTALHPAPLTLYRRLLHAATHARTDFAEMMLYFLTGVAIAAAMKTFLGATLLTQLGHGSVSGPATLMGTAFTLSLCSEADAFPAAGFTQFGFAAKLAFLVLSPMLDIKLLLMYRTLLRGRFLFVYSCAIVLGVALFAALLTLLGGAH
jgi:uncharacterized membrane protein YraQ (UPF0718 family)